MTYLDEMAGHLHQLATEKGFWPKEVDDIFLTKQLMMVVSEAVEVMEAIRKDQGNGAVASEMADILIRTLDLYAGMQEHGYVDIPVDKAVDLKTSYNKSRPERHGVKF